MEDTFSTWFESPLGIIEVCGTSDFITHVGFKNEVPEICADLPDTLQKCKQELEEFFAGKRKAFTISCQPVGTDFQKKVWQELLDIGYGDTVSYIDIAKKLKNPGAVRAVGLANGKNPIAIIIPCHRVIGDNGRLTGYGGGLWRKQWLLEHEGNTSGKQPTLFK
jgi:methylated-DNA-[protein]-cysteine S-methyltransferase